MTEIVSKRAKLNNIADKVYASYNAEVKDLKYVIQALTVQLDELNKQKSKLMNTYAKTFVLLDSLKKCVEPERANDFDEGLDGILRLLSAPVAQVPAAQIHINTEMKEQPKYMRACAVCGMHVYPHTGVFFMHKLVHKGECLNTAKHQTFPLV